MNDLSDLEKTQYFLLTAISMINTHIKFLIEENQLKDIYFQDEEMKHTSFLEVSQVILEDATYKPNDVGMTLYLILTIDGNGQSEIVAVCLLTEEDEGVLTSIAEIFKKHNQSLVRHKCCKDMVERNVFSRRQS